MSMVEPGFAKFLGKELSCTVPTACRWEWQRCEADGQSTTHGSRLRVFCPGCGSGYPWRDTYYLRRIYALEQRLAEQENP